VFLPRAVPQAAAIMAEVVARLAGRPGMINRGKIAELYHPDWVVGGEGWPLSDPLTIRRGLPQTLAWYRAAGWLPRDRRADRSGGEEHRETRQ
jgi:hypothetical protein